MIVFFFKNNADHIREQLNQYDNSCAFWYTRGLTSYRNIDTVISIKEISVEEGIHEDFIRDFPELVQKFSIKIFPSKTFNSSEVKKVSFFASNDTHIYLFKNVLEILKPNWDLYCRTQEKAYETGKSIGIEAVKVDSSIPNQSRYNTLVMSNDWGPLEQKINYEFISKYGNTLCIQESVIDFNKRDKRMQYCSMPLFQGIVTLKNVNLNKRIAAVIGNSRYEQLKPLPLPKKTHVLLNVNFTYGIHEEARDNWVNDILDSCNKLDIDYAISQHPRDRGDFSKFNLIKTNASTIHDVIEKSSILVTRFSSLIHEAICLGRSVIYYNPHGEKLFYDFEADGSNLFYVKNKEELLKALETLKDKTNENAVTNSSTYLNRHLGITTKGLVSHYTAALINDMAEFPLLRTVTVKDVLIRKAKSVKRKLLKQKL